MIWTLFGQFFDATVGQMVNALGNPQGMNRSSSWQDPSRRGRPALPPAPGGGSSPSPVAAWQSAGGSVTVALERQESRIAASPKDLDDDAIKLVKYALVSIQRCHERVLTGGVILVTTRMTSTSFASWIVALYLQSPEYQAAVARDRGNEITHDSKKYLRVSWGILTRWPRQEKSGCGTGKLDALKGIRDALQVFRLPPARPAAPPPAPARRRRTEIAATVAPAEEIPPPAAPAAVASEAPAAVPAETPREATLTTAGEIPAQVPASAAPAAEPVGPAAVRPRRPPRARPQPEPAAPAPEEPPPAEASRRPPGRRPPRRRRR